jgi:hypothetical protein
MWSEEEDSKVLARSDQASKDQCTLEHRNDINCPVIWFKYHIPTTANTTVTPDIIQLKIILDTVIAALQLPFPIDRAWLWSKEKTILLRGIPNLLTYTVICPQDLTYKTHQAPDPHFTATLPTLLNQIRDGLHSLFLNKDSLKTSNPNDIINYCTFSLPSVNDNDESLAYIIKGLDPFFVLQDKFKEVLTQRELGGNIFHAFHKLYKAAFPLNPLPHTITSVNDTDRIVIANLISTRRFHPKEATKAMMMITISKSHPGATALKEAIHTLCITKKQQLKIGGHKLYIQLVGPPNAQTSCTEYFQSIIDTLNPSLPGETHPRIFKNILIPTQLLDNPILLIPIANGTLTNCIALFINLANGFHQPTLNCQHLLLPLQ